MTAARRLYTKCALTAIAALLTLGSVQADGLQKVSRGRAHAPMVRVYDPSTGLPAQGPRNQSISGNWSGYALSSGSSGNYTSASFHWTVQSATYVNYPQNPMSFNDSSQWVGIGGYSTNDLIQLGSESFVSSSGTPSYDVWYELLPADETLLTNCTPASLSSCPVNPGDAMVASLSCTSNCTVNNSNTTWTLSMQDTTKGWSWTGNFTYASCLCSAEWIDEAPTFSEIVGISNFGIGSFTNLTVNSVSPAVSLAANAIILQDAQGGYATPCQAFNGNTIGSGNTFVVAYGQNCASTFDSHDFNDDAKSDLLWRDTSGDVAMWLMNGAQILSSAGVGGASPSVWSIAGQRDFNGDGRSDILWHDTSGDLAMWFMNGAGVIQSAGVGNAGGTWSVAGTGDFNGDGRGDLLFHDGSGNVAIWMMNGATVLKSCGVGNAPTNWSIVGTGDFNGDGYADILWHDTAGDVAIWFMNGCSVIQSSGVGNASPSVWSIAGTGDFNGDGKSDILWHDNSGDVAVWEMNGASILQSSGVGNANPSVWSIAETGDVNADGMSDILFHDTSGNVAVWEMNGASIVKSAGIGNASASVWAIQGLGAD
jgi:hypothetical protein